MAEIIEKERVKTDLDRNVPAAEDADIKIMDQVLLFQEKPINKWTGPFQL